METQEWIYEFDSRETVDYSLADRKISTAKDATSKLNVVNEFLVDTKDVKKNRFFI